MPLVTEENGKLKRKFFFLLKKEAREEEAHCFECFMRRAQ